MPYGIWNHRAIARKPNLILFGNLNTGSDLSWILGNSGGSSAPPTPVNLTSQVNGVTAVFALGAAPTSTVLTQVFLNGVKQMPTTDYSVTGSTLTMAFVPQVGDYLYVLYW